MTIEEGKYYYAQLPKRKKLAKVKILSIYHKNLNAARCLVLDNCKIIGIKKRHLFKERIMRTRQINGDFIYTNRNADSAELNKMFEPKRGMMTQWEVVKNNKIIESNLSYSEGTALVKNILDINGK